MGHVLETARFGGRREGEPMAAYAEKGARALELCAVQALAVQYARP